MQRPYFCEAAVLHHHKQIPSGSNCRATATVLQPALAKGGCEAKASHLLATCVGDPWELQKEDRDQQARRTCIRLWELQALVGSKH
mmetsp:Transcript_11111/g.19871  ORF Transcript_11111/g.19871 Transcript_11111/m.19871 type:complete len:86 (-) Transcript_11111:103-360(-)